MSEIDTNRMQGSPAATAKSICTPAFNRCRVHAETENRLFSSLSATRGWCHQLEFY